MKEQAYNIIKTKDSITQRQSNINKSKKARFKISPQEFKDHTLREIVSLKYVCEHGSSESAGKLGISQKPSLGGDYILLGWDEAIMSTQEYMKKFVEDVGEDEDFKSGSWVSATDYVNANGGIVSGCLGDIKNFLNNGKLDQVVAIVKSCSPSVIGDLTVTMKDISGTIPRTIHHKVIGEGGYGKDITVGVALILANVLVFSHKPSMHYLNITMRNVVKVFRKDTVPGSGSGNVSVITVESVGLWTDKSPGLDGFTFGFYRGYWSFLEKDVEQAVRYFFHHGTFSKAGNSYFIALILKIHNANKGIFFGDKWRRWIQSSLISSKGPVIVNGSLTSEFQFHRGLKQGDSLSPFLFILIMESHHILFQRVVDAGMFRGIFMGTSFQLLHLFYADDAIFIGQWSDSNISVIVKVLECFYRALGLRINMNKSKLMGIFVANDIVDQADNNIGCTTLKDPFSYLGSKVDNLMSRTRAWNDILNNRANRLSKWKMKTLSIGGRLSLLKSVLGSTPIYHMSLFKVPIKVLQKMESIRCHFFIGVDQNGKKLIWVKWNKVLASKEKGGLGIHGEDGKLNKNASHNHSSIWLDIVREMMHLKNNGMDLCGYIHKKMGNGFITSFWQEVWRGEDDFKSAYPRVFALETRKCISVAEKLSQESFGYSFRRNPRSGIEQA
ncbi:RNA-directed DNA polymerase, eukaryota, reverse transcriptase zinc-binding domain protein [Tanacetum coccineum]|uniref:RNA-directed DNA polymerase, eukaryota, reverse transcriptase zinc-binding domain protein n=1 Tax=Tanacetum coccineum TaxID=301880 RepID=A0ABQ5ATA2_9ASTR